MLVSFQNPRIHQSFLPRSERSEPSTWGGATLSVCSSARYEIQPGVSFFFFGRFVKSPGDFLDLNKNSMYSGIFCQLQWMNLPKDLFWIKKGTILYLGHFWWWFTTNQTSWFRDDSTTKLLMGGAWLPLLFTHLMWFTHLDPIPDGTIWNLHGCFQQ